MLSQQLWQCCQCSPAVEPPQVLAHVGRAFHPQPNATDHKSHAAPMVPQGDLPKMDPEKAKFIAVPNTPPDPPRTAPATVPGAK